MTFEVYSVADILELNDLSECDTLDGRRNQWGCSFAEDGTVTITPNGIYPYIGDEHFAEPLIKIMHVSVSLRIQHELMKVLLKSEDMEDAAQIIEESEGGILDTLFNSTQKEMLTREAIRPYLPPRIIAILNRIVQIMRDEPRKPRADHSE